MNNLLRRFFNSLSYQVDKNIRESLYKNKTFLRNRWGFFEKSIITWSTHYKKYTLLTLFLAILVAFNGIQWQPWIKPYVMKYLPNWRQLLEWQGTFLGGQLTIIAVVYPLVIGLISILFQNKSAKKVIFPIYEKYSGFMFAGLSGLLLSWIIVVGYFLRPTISDNIYAAICLTSALWLSANLWLTAWFFVKTCRMLDENSLEVILFRFSIHETGEIDLRRRIKQLLLQNAVHHELIVNPDQEVMRVWTYKLSGDDYQKITRTVNLNNDIKDVKLWLINFAIRLQIFILKLKKINNGELVIQPFRATMTSNIMIVARYNGFEINPIVQFVINLAFCFDKNVPKANIGLSRVLSALVGPASDALTSGDAREFSYAVDRLAMWHTEIAQALSFKNDNGDQDNWLLLPSSIMWRRNYLDELLSEYYRLAREAVERISYNSSFYTEMLHLHRRIYSSRDTLVKQEVRSLIQGSYNLWYLLVEWRSYNSESTDLKIANKYEDIIYDFISAWESWLMHIKIHSKPTGGINTEYQAVVAHLEFTASTAISALRFNNFEAAGWGVDMLVNWLNNISSDHWEEEYSWRSVLINHYLLTIPQNDAVWQAILKGDEYNYRAAFDLSLQNAHIDLRIITACYMLLKPGDDQHDLLPKYIKALLTEDRIHPSSSVRQLRIKIAKAGDLLGAYIRHRDYGHYGRDTYGDWLSSILESFGRIYEERRVSGRIYTGWGANDPRSMNRAYVEIAISMSATQWSLPRALEDALFSNYFRHRDRNSIISDLHDWINIANDVHNCILVDSGNLEEFKINFVSSIKEVIKKISDNQKKTEEEADIDQDRLIKFGVVSSTIFRSEGNPEFPLVLFEHIDRDAELGENCAFPVIISNYAKKEIALGVEIDRAINEDDYISGIISNQLKLNVLRALLKYPQSESYKYTDTNNILLDILNMSEAMACPVLFVGSEQLTSTLRRSFYTPEVANRYGIKRQDGFEKEYICHIGRCEVYSFPFSDIDYCILTSKELFNKVSFRKIANDQYVDVNFELNEESTTDGKLVLKYWLKVDLTDDISCIKLELSVKEDDFE